MDVRYLFNFFMELKLQQFSGPLDLLLNLIEEQKLPITELSISAVTEQYLEYLTSLEREAPDEIADFLVIASRILLMKAKAIVPMFSLEEENEKSLEDQLRIYKKFVEASRLVNKSWLAPVRSFFRIEPVRKAEGFVPPENATTASLHKSMMSIVARLKPPKPLPQIEMDKTVSVKEVIERIKDLLKSHKQFDFHKSLKEKENKTELILGFLALLELVKQQIVHLDQQSHFGDILVRKV